MAGMQVRRGRDVWRVRGGDGGWSRTIWRGAKTAASAALRWYIAAMVAEIAMGAVHVWVLFNFLKVLQRLSLAVGN